MVSGLLVAPITIISPLLFAWSFDCVLRSSKQAAIYATILISKSLEAFSLFPAILSNSSINIMAGAFSFTAENICLIFSSDYPDRLDTISGPFNL